jgi:outer membrane immunogenic protein
MKKLLLAGAIATFMASGANAADMPLKAPLYKAPPPPAIYSWTGFYLGGNVGGTTERVTNDYTAPGPGFPGFIAGDQVAISVGSSNAFSQSTVTFGAQAGYNYQFNHVGLIGVELDINRLGFSNSVNVTFPTPFAGPVNSMTSQSMDWLFTARARLGLIFADRWLAYGTAGLAVVNVGFSETNIYSPAFNAAGVDSINLGTTQTGFTAGGGLEYAIADHWSIKGEYLHVWLPDLSGVSMTPSPFFGGPPAVLYSHNVSSSIDIARFGFNFHWN